MNKIYQDGQTCYCGRKKKKTTKKQTNKQKKKKNAMTDWADLGLDF